MRKILGFVLLFSGLGSSLSAFAKYRTSYPVEVSSASIGAQTKDTCTEIGLIADQNLPLWTTFRFQNPSNWCGAYALADELSYITKTSVSALQIGASYWRNLNPNFKQDADFQVPEGSLSAQLGYSRGAPCEILAWVQANGICSAKNLDDVGITLAQIIQAAPKPTKKILSYVADFVKTRCKPKVTKQIARLNCSYRVMEEGTRLSGDIDAELEAGRMPLLTFNQGPLYSSSSISKQTLPHEVTINARHWNTQRQRCEYRLRTSTGFDTCDQYDSAKVTCDETEFALTLQFWVDAQFIDSTGYQLAIVK